MLPKSYVDGHVRPANTNGAKSEARVRIDDIDAISGTGEDPPIPRDPDAVVKVRDGIVQETGAAEEPAGCDVMCN